MIGFLKNLVIGVTKRFLRNQPINRYEKIVFDSVRSAFAVFGEVPVV